MPVSNILSAVRHLAIGIASVPAVVAAPLAMNGPGSYSQDFDALPSNGTDNAWADDLTLPGWYSQRTGTGTFIASDAGTGTGGNLFSYGAENATERALGAIGSSNAAAGNFAHGVLLQNTSGSELIIDSLAYTGEQWRKSGATEAQVITLWYKTSSSPIPSLDPGKSTDSGWTPLADGDFRSPVNTPLGTALDGNDSANRTGISIHPNISVPAGSYVMIRWKDIDHTGYDHGLAIDDVALSWIVNSTTLSPGAIAFIGFNADGGGDLAFVALAPIATGTKMFFTDNEWNGMDIGAGGAFNSGEGILTWAAPLGGVGAGMVVTLSRLSSTGWSASVGTITPSGNFVLSGSGETVYAYQGAASAPDNFLAVIATHSQDPVSGTGLDSSHRVYLTANADVATYVGSRCNQTSFAGYLAAIGDPSNWLTEDGEGDQSTNMTAPDVPFAATAFSLTHASGYAAWASNCAPGQAANEDHDHDGVPNGVEYFMGDAHTASTPNPQVVNGKISWPHSASANASYVVKTSTDLIHWEPAPSSDVTDVGASIEYSLPAGQSQIFVRLEVLTTP